MAYDELVIDASIVGLGRSIVLSLSTISINVWRLATNVKLVVNAIIIKCKLSSCIKPNASTIVGS